MKIKWTIRGILLALLVASSWACFSFYTGRPTKAIRATSRDDWISQAKAELRHFKPSVATPLAEIKNDARGVYTCYIGNGQLVRIGLFGWVYVLSHSAHTDERDRQEGRLDTNTRIGDVNLAVDHRGRLYYSEAHPCDVLAAELGSRRRFSSVREFVETPVAFEEEKKWREIRWDDIPKLELRPASTESAPGASSE